MAGGLLNFLAPRREQRNVLSDAQRLRSMADNAPVNALAAPGGLLAIPGVPKQKSVMGGLLAASSVAPGIGDFTGPMADAHMYATDPSSRTPGNYAMSALGLLPFVPSLAGITAFHGSPHLFDNFDMSKIGTGEGAQAYGHGLYFAEAPDVAKEYQRNLANVDRNTGRANAHMNAQNWVQRLGDEETAATIFRDKIAEATANGEDAAPFIDTLQMIESGAYKGPLPNAGALYTVDIPDEAVARMLDWDAPLSEQPEAVQRALMNLPDAHKLKPEMTGAQLLESRYLVAGDYADKAKASEKLRKLGITGIKYYDGASRTQGQGTRNFVVFDDKLPKILKRE